MALEAHRARVGGRTDVLVDGHSRRGASQWSGRDPHNRLVNFSAASDVPRGAYADVTIDGYTPHSLLGRESALAR